ncbi:MAG: T9SS type A sorting domain-containing protein [Bacteroidota bacterium]
MKKLLLFMAFSFFLVLGAISQDNLLKGDCESASDWGIFLIGDKAPTILFMNPFPVPKYGVDNNLKISYKFAGHFEAFIYQTVTLKVGKTYEFSGAYKDAGTKADANYYWFQITVMPVNGYTEMATNGPDWELYGENPSFLQSFGVWGSPDNLGGLGQDTVFSGSKHYGGAFTGVLQLGCNQGDTTIFTVGNTYPTATGDLELGADGTEVDFFFVFYFGQGASGDNDLSFVFDEFSIHEYGSSGLIDNKVNSINFSIYPNPVRESLNINCASGISTVSLVNIVGQEVLKTNNFGDNNMNVNMSGLEKGLYIISVKDANGITTSQKVLKK